MGISVIGEISVNVPVVFKENLTSVLFSECKTSFYLKISRFFLLAFKGFGNSPSLYSVAIEAI